MPPRRYSDEQLSDAVASARTMREVLTALGLVPRGGNYETVWRRIEHVGLDASHLRRWRLGSPIASATDEQIAAAVSHARSFAQVLRELGARGGASHRQLRRRVERLGLDLSHFSGQAWRRGQSVPTVQARPLHQVLVDGSLTNTSRLKLRLIAEGVRSPRCAMCGLEGWNGKPIALELDHIDGRRENNRISNLRLLCPNYHAQTPTYRGRNAGARGYPGTPRPGGGMHTHRS